jgi:putative transcriptional regulator
METTESLVNQLLIAMPGMADPNFSSTVTLICEHNDEGALGIVINRPLNLRLGGLFEQLHLDNPDPAALDHPVLLGGPVGPERGFVLHDSSHRYENSLAISSEICLSLVALGYAGWDAGQLEAEMLANAWLNVLATQEIVFDMPFADRWAAAARALGVDLTLLSPEAGHA